MALGWTHAGHDWAMCSLVPSFLHTWSHEDHQRHNIGLYFCLWWNSYISILIQAKIVANSCNVNEILLVWQTHCFFFCQAKLVFQVHNLYTPLGHLRSNATAGISHWPQGNLNRYRPVVRATTHDITLACIRLIALEFRHSTWSYHFAYISFWVLIVEFGIITLDTT